MSAPQSSDEIALTLQAMLGKDDVQMFGEGIIFAYQNPEYAQWLGAHLAKAIGSPPMIEVRARMFKELIEQIPAEQVDG